MGPVRILLGDDHTVVRQGLCKILEEQPAWSVIAQASDGREAVQQTLALQPDVAVLDIAMPLLNGIEATRQIVRRASNVHVLILSMHAEEAYITQSVQAGARGYLLKDSADTDLVRGVAAVAAGKSFFSPAAAKVMLDEYVRHLSEKGIVNRHEALSEREREILQLIAEGHSSRRSPTCCRSARPPSIRTGHTSSRSWTCTARRSSSSTRSGGASSADRRPSESISLPVARTISRRTEAVDWLIFVGVLALWWVLQAWLLPRMGVPT